MWIKPGTKLPLLTTGELSWERGTLLFNMEKKKSNPTNITLLLWEPEFKVLKQENFHDKSKVFTGIFSYWTYFFQIIFVKLEPASYLSDHVTSEASTLPLHASGRYDLYHGKIADFLFSFLCFYIFRC